MKQIFWLSIIGFLLMACQPPEKEKSGSESVTTEPIENPYYSRTDTTILNLPDSVWKRVLPDSIYKTVRNKKTEKAFKNKYWDFTGIGTYYCAACGNKLFTSDSKFASACGWPTFFETSRKNSVRYVVDSSHGLKRTEVLCGRCGGHLGHLFKDGPPPTHNRYCMNSLALDFVPELKQF